MNNSFDIQRFGKLVWHDVRRCLPALGNVGATMLGLLAFTPLTTMMQGATGLEQGASYRLALMTTMTLFLASTVPTQLYANIGPKRKWTGWISLQSKGLSRVFSNTTISNK